MSEKFHLYFDDTGSREPNGKFDSTTPRADGFNCFGLGGVIIRDEDIGEVYRMYREFCDAWNIDYPLHSSKIRGRRGKFAWLKGSKSSGKFLNELRDFLIEIPVLGTACVIDRPGYRKRYEGQYQGHLWSMCKTAFSILIERSAKFADKHNRQLEVFHEMSGKKEDRDIRSYMKELKQFGSPFSTESSSAYRPLQPADYRRIVLGEPQQRTKNTPMLQIADLFLYPIAKGKYDKDYRSYCDLLNNGKLINSALSEEEISSLGVKYSCFD